MDENRTEYEPNFVMRDPKESPLAENTSYVSADTFFGDEGPAPTPQPKTPTEEDGLYVDPREKFRNGAAASARWAGGKARAESGHPGSGFSRAGSGGGGDKGKGKRSEPVTLTKKGLALLVACCMAISLIFGMFGAGIGNSIWGGSQAGVVTTETADSSEDGAVSTTGYNLQNATGSNMSIQEITKSAQKSVVEIKTEGVVSDSWMQQYVTEGAGSGVIISKDGYIMTNNHVIKDASKITVTTSDKHSYEATLIGADSMNDVAVLKIKATGLTPAAYGNSDQLQVGDMAVAIGNPLGELGGTVTAGIISATDRELSIDGKTMKLLQTDSSINPGNSGGGLFNGDGQLIGLVVAKSAGSDVEGLGFAIPINTAASVAQQLMDKGYVSGQPWTGMTYTEGSSGLDFLFGGSSGGTVYIYSVDTDVAREAGFKPGDVLYAVDDREITSIDDLTTIISAHKVGDRLTFTIVRDGQSMNLKITLQEKTKEQVTQ
ncbi:MAG: S1C family serine protease [Bacillota bacterium]